MWFELDGILILHAAITIGLLVDVFIFPFLGTSLAQDATLGVLNAFLSYKTAPIDIEREAEHG